MATFIFYDLLNSKHVSKYGFTTVTATRRQVGDGDKGDKDDKGDKGDKVTAE